MSRHGWAIGREVAVLALSLVLLGCGADCTPRSGPVRPNVVLVTIDTLRADHLGCYGSQTVQTPHLDRLAREGVLFERAWAQTHLTAPSHLTILSSLPLAMHGVTDNDVAPTRPVEVLPDVFARAGYRTAAFVGAKHMGPEGPLASVLRAFEVIRAPRRTSVPKRAKETNREVFRWLRGACREPFFLWIHYWDPHMPYAPPEPWDTAYYQGDPRDPRHTSMDAVTFNWFFHELGDVRARLARRAREVRALKRDLGARTRQVRQLVLYPQGLGGYVHGPEAEAHLRGRLLDVAAHLRPGLPLRRHITDWLTGIRDLEFPLAEYRGEVSYVDQEVGRLRDEIERLGISGRTAVIVTADHGESLGEHGVFFNHFGLYEPNLRVPLIVWAPGRVAPARRTDLARGLDVAPTALGLAALPVPRAMQGRDLLGGVDGTRPIVAEAMRDFQIMAFDGRWKLIRTRKDFFYLEGFAYDAGATELYDLDADPAERVNLAAAEPSIARALGRHVDRWLSMQRVVGSEAGPAAAPPPGGVPPDLRDALRALGYAE
jgi:arylsulfatase A-like enzyme